MISNARKSTIVLILGAYILTWPSIYSFLINMKTQADSGMIDDPWGTKSFHIIVLSLFVGMILVNAGKNRVQRNIMRLFIVISTFPYFGFVFVRFIRWPATCGVLEACQFHRYLKSGWLIMDYYLLVIWLAIAGGMFLIYLYSQNRVVHKTKRDLTWFGLIYFPPVLVWFGVEWSIGIANIHQLELGYGLATYSIFVSVIWMCGAGIADMARFLCWRKDSTLGLKMGFILMIQFALNFVVIKESGNYDGLCRFRGASALLGSGRQPCSFAEYFHSGEFLSISFLEHGIILYGYLLVWSCAFYFVRRVNLKPNWKRPEEMPVA